MVNPEFLRPGDLKKQSQFAGGQIGVNIYLKGNYDNKPACGHGKNKANDRPSAGKLKQSEWDNGQCG